MRKRVACVQARAGANGSFCLSVRCTVFALLSKSHPMKIRAAFPLLLIVVALGACTGSATAPEARPAAPISFDSIPTPSDSTSENGGGSLGSGN